MWLKGDHIVILVIVLNALLAFSNYHAVWWQETLILTFLSQAMYSFISNTTCQSLSFFIFFIIKIIYLFIYFIILI